MTLTATQKARRAAQVAQRRTAQNPPAQKPKNKGKGKQPQKQLPRKPAARAAMPVVEASNLTASFATSSFGNKGGIRIRGRDPVTVLGATQIPANTPFASALNILISPSRFDGTRLQSYGTIYERYRFERMRFIWSPTCPTSTAGGLLMSYDVDATDPTPDASELGFRVYLGHRCSVTFSPWEVAVLEVVPDPVDKQFYYTGTLNQLLGGVDERLSYQGQFYLAQTSAGTGTAAGVLWFEYDVVFDEPQLNPILNNWVSAKLEAANAPASSQDSLAGMATVAGSNTTYLPIVQDSGNHQAVSIPPLTRCILQYYGTSSAALTGIGAQTLNALGQTVTGTTTQDLGDASISAAQFIKRWVVNNTTSGKLMFHPFLSNAADAAKITLRSFVAELIPLKGTVF